MSKVPAIVPVSDLRDDAASVLDRLRKSHEPVVITQRGRAAAVLLSIEEYERSEHEREILRLLARAKKSLRRLAAHQQSGRRIPEFPQLDQREVVVPPYRFFYRVERATVWIVSVWHGAQKTAAD